MGLTIYKDIFGMAAFPIFATDKRGILLYKNQSCRKYLPMMRKSASVLRHLHMQEMPDKPFTAKIKGDTPYETAVALYNGEFYLFLAFSRLQYPDGSQAVNDFFTVFGTTPESFLATLRNGNCRENKAPSRIYTDILGLMGAKNAFTGKELYSAASLFEIFSEKITGTFQALGYRVTTKSDGFLGRYPVYIPLFDCLFLLGRLFYLTTRIGEDGSLLLTAESDEENHIFTLSCHSEKEVPEDVLEAVQRYAPECYADFAFLHAFSALSGVRVGKKNENTAFLSLSIPYVKSKQGILLRNTATDRQMAKIVARLLSSVRSAVKGNLSIS